MVTDRLDFQQIKASVSLEQVFATYHLHFNRSGLVLRGRCPLPTHQNTHNKWSFSANLQRDLWACHSESCVKGRNGKLGGDIFDFVALMEGSSIIDAARKLQQWFVISNSNPAAKTKYVNEQRENPLKPLPFQLKNINPEHKYIEQRGITSSTAKQFGIGFYAGDGYFSGRIVIPIHDDYGQLVAYAGRAVDNAIPKYKLPKGFSKSALLFNFCRLEKPYSSIVIVEGFFDCMVVWQAGFTNVVSLMGSSLSQKQQKLILDRFRTAILMLDGDQAGERATLKILQLLAPCIFVRVINVANGKQPDQLSQKEIQNHLNFLR